MTKTPYDAELSAPTLPLRQAGADRTGVVRLQEWLVTRGYRIWAEAIEPKLKELLGEK